MKKLILLHMQIEITDSYTLKKSFENFHTTT